MTRTHTVWPPERTSPAGSGWRGVTAASFISCGRAIDRALEPASLNLAILLLAFGEVLLFTPRGEETGWRGYLLPNLLQRFGPAADSVIVGALWAVWLFTRPFF